jgi:hypothetical protein
MVFTETIFPPGKVLYKGLEGIPCQVLLRDTRFFYLTESFPTAKNYGNPCGFRVKKTLRLFDLTHKNVVTLLSSKYPISSDTKGLLRIVLGTGITIGEQVAAVRQLLGKDAGKLPKDTNTREGQRLSYKELNKKAFGALAREFLIPEGYDGYYAPAKKSVFHGGTFHHEIMLNNAYQKIERLRGPAPVISEKSFSSALPRIFMDYCKKTTRLVRPYGGNLTIFCTGGMGVRLYLMALGKELPPKIRRTNDFDFTFAVPRKLASEKLVSTYALTMRTIMYEHLNGFVRYLNKNYQGINASLRVNRFKRSKYDAPRLQVPGTGRRVYQVMTWQIITGKKEVTDLVDTALAVYPRASRDMLHLPFSYKAGIPIQKLKYQLKDSLALLSGSLLHKGLISKRNPLIGEAKEKGQKNAERVKELMKVIRKKRTYYKNLVPIANSTGPLLVNLNLENLRAARRNAVAVNKALKKIK